MWQNVSTLVEMFNITGLSDVYITCGHANFITRIKHYITQRWSNRTRVLVLMYSYSCTRTRVRVLFEYSYSSTKESNRTRVHYQSNCTHDYFSPWHFFIWTVASKYITDKNSNIRSNLINVIIIKVFILYYCSAFQLNKYSVKCP